MYGSKLNTKSDTLLANGQQILANISNYQTKTTKNDAPTSLSNIKKPPLPASMNQERKA